MGSKFIKPFAVFAGLYPFVLGILVVVNQQALIPKDATPEQALKLFGYHLSSGNIAFGLTMLAAVLSDSPQALAFLLLFRGITDLIDGVVGLITNAAPAGTEIGVMIIAVIALAAAYHLFSTSKAVKK